MTTPLRDPARVDAEIDALAERSFAFLERLVSEPSVLGREAGAQAVVAAELERLGFAVELLEVPEAIGTDTLAGVPQMSYADRPVVVGRLAAGDGPTLLCNAHVDVVPAEAPERWSTGPFTPTRRDGWLYGRGAGDMKCGFAMVLLAVEALRRAEPEAIGGTLAFVSAIEEECTGNGTLAALRAGVLGDAVLLPEPTGLEILVGGSGVLWCDFAVSGRAGHAHDAQSGANPILACLTLVDALRALEIELNAARDDGEDKYCAVNVGTIAGGDWRSSSPTGARLGVRVGYPARWDVASAQRAVRGALERATSAPGWPAGAGVTLSFDGFRAVGYRLDPAHPLVRRVADAHESVHGNRPQPYRLASTTDARHYLNELALPALCYGPRVRNIHGVDEAVELASIVAGARTLTRFIPAFMQHDEVPTE
jgi:acetylornithine deacetylase